MKRLLPLLLVTALIAACGTTPVAPSDATPPPVVGGDRDEHGCIGSAGYSWCEAKQKCLRPWEEECSSVPTGENTVRASVPQGDFAPDTRDPREVCQALTEEREMLKGCTLTEAKASQDDAECVDGKSVAGCFACAFTCGSVVLDAPIVGGDRDERGCIGSAGYSWCEAKQKCLRPWEEECYASGAEAVTALLKQQYPDAKDTLTFTLIEETDTHLRGSVRFGPVGTPGGIVLAKKSGGMWLISYEGNGSVDCATLKADEFPADMLTGICD